MPTTAKPMKRPDLTPAQIVAVVGSLLALCVSFGLPIDQAQTDAIIDTTKQLASLLIGGDAIIRLGRSLSQR